MEEALIEVPTLRRFAGIGLTSDRIPDETTILTFRYLLEKHNLGAQIFETVKTQHSARWMTMRQGTLDDAHDRCTQFHQEQSREERFRDASDQEGQPVVLRDEDPDRRDRDSGLIHSVVVTASNVHDLTPAAELLHADEEIVYGDSG